MAKDIKGTADKVLHDAQGAADQALHNPTAGNVALGVASTIAGVGAASGIEGGANTINQLNATLDSQFNEYGKDVAAGRGDEAHAVHVQIQQELHNLGITDTSKIDTALQKFGADGGSFQDPTSYHNDHVAFSGAVQEQLGKQNPVGEWGHAVINSVGSELHSTTGIIATIVGALAAAFGAINVFSRHHGGRGK